MHDGPKNMPVKKCAARAIIRDAGGKPILDQFGNYQYRPCQKYTMVGANVCSIHGGKGATARKASEEHMAIRQAEAMIWSKAGDLLDMFGLHNVHPMEGLLDVVQRCYAMVRVTGLLLGELNLDPTGKVTIVANPRAVDLDGVDDLEAELEDPELPPVRRMEVEELLKRANNDARRGQPGIPQIFKLTEAMYGLDHLGDGTPHVLVTMYGDWLDRYQRACKTALDANIDERLVRQTEHETDRLFQAVTAALKACDLTFDQQDKFKKALAQQLRTLTDGSPASGPPPDAYGPPAKLALNTAGAARTAKRVFIDTPPDPETSG